jgi:hypothetical protein
MKQNQLVHRATSIPQRNSTYSVCGGVERRSWRGYVLLAVELIEARRQSRSKPENRNRYPSVLDSCEHWSPDHVALREGR